MIREFFSFKYTWDSLLYCGLLEQFKLLFPLSFMHLVSSSILSLQESGINFLFLVTYSNVKFDGCCVDVLSAFQRWGHGMQFLYLPLPLK